MNASKLSEFDKSDSDEEVTKNRDRNDVENIVCT